jgi:hypothetical protein
MSALALAATMDALAAKFVSAGVVANAYAYPAETIQPVCAIVGYPEIDFDLTMGRGGDTARFPVYVVVGRVREKAARDPLSALITGAAGTKNALDGTLTYSGTTYGDARVTDCRIETLTVAGVEYLCATFDVEVYT